MNARSQKMKERRDGKSANDGVSDVWPGMLALPDAGMGMGMMPGANGTNGKHG